jgi:hypothetical protein
MSSCAIWWWYRVDTDVPGRKVSATAFGALLERILATGWVHAPA